MQQTTFQAYLNKRLGKQYTIEDPFAQLERLLTDDNVSDLEEIRYKASLSFMTLIDDYIKRLSDEKLIFRPIRFRGSFLFTDNQIKDYFYSLDRANSISNRMQLVKEWLVRSLAQMERDERKKDWVSDEIELLDEDTYHAVSLEMKKESEYEDTFDDFEREESKLAKILVARQFQPLKQAVKQMKFIDVNSLYRQLFTVDELFQLPQHAQKLPPNWQQICADTSKRMKKKQLHYQDTTPLLYLQDQLEGKKSEHVHSPFIY